MAQRTRVEDEGGDDLLERFAFVLVLGVIVVPGVGELVGLGLGQAGPAVVAGRVTNRGEPVEGAV
ncbi:hypothetical protein [Nonomuraea sp. CA-141351]|uniref:hypothetical protein n=1 Tax=Nonomuraea sp. CA-141351 TaxID=3239996 RepID=UPI003D945798